MNEELKRLLEAIEASKVAMSNHAQDGIESIRKVRELALAIGAAEIANALDHALSHTLTAFDLIKKEINK